MQFLFMAAERLPLALLGVTQIRLRAQHFSLLVVIAHDHAQVRQNCLLDSTCEAAVEADQTILAAQVEDAITAAFSSLVDEQSTLVQEPCQSSPGLTLLQRVSCKAVDVTINLSRQQVCVARCSSTAHGLDSCGFSRLQCLAVAITD